MRTDTKTLIEAMQILARDIQSGDGVANAAIAEAADRMEELAEFKQDIENQHRMVMDESCTAGEKHCTCVPALRWEIEKRDNEIKRLRAIVDKLPKTADGVTVGPGTSTWQYSDFSGAQDEPREYRWGVLPWFDHERLQQLIGKTYSTPEAAKAARQKGGE